MLPEWRFVFAQVRVCRCSAPLRAAINITHTEGVPVIILGLILLIVGLVAHIPILTTIGVILIVVGVVLALLGRAGNAIGGRKHWY